VRGALENSGNSGKENCLVKEERKITIHESGGGGGRRRIKEAIKKASSSEEYEKSRRGEKEVP